VSAGVFLTLDVIARAVTDKHRASGILAFYLLAAAFLLAVSARLSSSALLVVGWGVAVVVGPAVAGGWVVTGAPPPDGLGVWVVVTPWPAVTVAVTSRPPRAIRTAPVAPREPVVVVDRLCLVVDGGSTRWQRSSAQG